MKNWVFDKRNDGSDTGWNNSNINTFREHRTKSFVREILQNSLDNPLQANSNDPVRVTFTDHRIKREEIPGMDSLEKVLQEINDALKQNPESENDTKRIRIALEVAKRPEVNVIEIRDSNTSGISSKLGEQDHFHTYLKTEGSSSADASRTGSHGLGKYAPLSLSDLRTIFVSTNFLQNGELKTLFQGRTVLMTRKIDLLGRYNHIGYWGGDNFSPLEEVPKNFPWMNTLNSEPGTSIFVIGRGSNVTSDRLFAGHAIMNYFAAFHRNKLEIDVNGSLVNSANYQELFLRENIQNALLRDGETKTSLNRVESYIECLQEDKKYSLSTSSPIGSGKLYLLKKEDADQKIAVIRNNILITDELSGFKRKNGAIEDFSGIYECTNEEGNKFLRRMEPPQHNSLSVNYLPDNEQDMGTKSLAALKSDLKVIIEEQLTIASSGGGVIDWAAEILPDIAGENENDEFSPDADIDPNGMFLLPPLKKKLNAPKSLGLFNENAIDDDSDAEGPGGAKDSGQGAKGGGGDGFGAGAGDGQGGSNTSAHKTNHSNRSSAHIVNTRHQKISANSIVVYFNFNRSEACQLTTHEVGSDNVELLKIHNSNLGEVIDGKVILPPSSDKKTKIQLSFNRVIRGGLQLEICGVEQ